MKTQTPKLPLAELPFVKQMMALLLDLQRQKIHNPRLDECDKDLLGQICEPRVFELQKSFDAHELQQQAFHFLRETDGRDNVFNAMQELDYWPMWENHFLQCVIIYGAIYELGGLDDYEISANIW